MIKYSFVAGDIWVAFALERKKQERRLYSHIAFNCDKTELQSFKKIVEKMEIQQ